VACALLISKSIGSSNASSRVDHIGILHRNLCSIKNSKIKEIKVLAYFKVIEVLHNNESSDILNSVQYEDVLEGKRRVLFAVYCLLSRII
jgi:hypothetical protein